MKYFRIFTISIISILSSALVLVYPLAAVPEQPSSKERKQIVIAELKTHGVAADDEFVELFNPNDTAVNVTGWVVQYRSASTLPTKAWVDKTSTGKDQDTKARLGCGVDCTLEIAPKGRLLIASTAAHLSEADVIVAGSLGFASTGGQVRLASLKADGSFQQEDLVGYGKNQTTGVAAQTAEGVPAPTHSSSGSLLRNEADGEPEDTDDNFTDFSVSQAPTPGEAEPTPEPEPTPETSPTPPPNTDTPASPVPAPLPTSYPMIYISELLPDPASPLVDSEDEYVELYNPGDSSVNLKGYSVVAGTTTKYKHTFLEDTYIAGKSHLTIYSGDSDLSLSNSGSTVVVIAPNGKELFRATYGSAHSGDSWSLGDNNSWRWTGVPTPGAVNNFSASSLEQSTIAKKKAAKKKATSKSSKKSGKAKATKTKKTTSKKTKKPAKAKKAKKTKVKDASATQEPVQKYDASMWVVGGMAMLTSGYVAYDYRKNFSGAFRRLFKR